MGRWTDIATWAGPIRNSGDGDGTPLEPADRMPGHVGVVIHIAQGTFDGTVSWERNPTSRVGSHFITARDGRCIQMIDTQDVSWCQADGNSHWLSIENEGWFGQALTDGQVQACARILARAHAVYGVPLRVTNTPTVGGLGWHGMGGAAWGGHTDCPGPTIRAQLPAIVARATQLVEGGQPVADMADTYVVALSTGVRTWKTPNGTTMPNVPVDFIIQVQRWMAATDGRLGGIEQAVSRAPQPPVQAHVDAAQVAAALAADPGFIAGLAEAIVVANAQRVVD